MLRRKPPTIMALHVSVYIRSETIYRKFSQLSIKFSGNVILRKSNLPVFFFFHLNPGAR